MSTAGYVFNGVEYEPYDLHWGFTNFLNKVVLDCGADTGATPSYFLSRGARRVIAVSGREEYKGLVINHEKFNWLDRVVPVDLWISKSQDFIDLISKFNPDILKCDLDPETRTCKLAELYLYECPDEILKLVPEYLIEWHDNECPECVLPNHMEMAWKSRFSGLGYRVEMKFHSGIVVWARRG